MTTVKYGDIFSALVQCIHVNGWADRVNPNEWKQVENVVVAPGQQWYYGTFEYDEDDDDDNLESESELESSRSSNSESEKYLIWDNVGPDGWGSVNIYKDIKVTGYQNDRTLPVITKVTW